MHAAYRLLDVLKKVVVKRAVCIRVQTTVVLRHTRIHDAKQCGRPKRQRQLYRYKTTSGADPWGLVAGSSPHR